MKKYILILLVAITALFSSCAEDKYSVYNFGFANWRNSLNVDNKDKAMNQLYEKIAEEFIARGYVLRGYQIHSDNITANDDQALSYFKQNFDRIQGTDLTILEKMLEGAEGAPFTITVDYMLLRGSDAQTLLKQEPITINIKVKPAN